MGRAYTRRCAQEIKKFKMKPEISNIVSEYERGLYIPDVKPQTQYILCPVGLIGSGKTTVLKLLSKELWLVRLSSDDVGQALHDENLIPASNDMAEIMEGLFENYLSKGYSIAADMDCASASSQEFLVELKLKHNLPLIWIHINPPEDFILEIGLNNKPSWMFESKDAAVESYKKRKNLHKDFNAPFVYIFDTSLPNLPAQVIEASKLIKQYLLSNP